LINSKVEVHSLCGTTVTHLAPHAVSYCPLCELIVEGETEIVDLEKLKEEQDPGTGGFI